MTKQFKFHGVEAEKGEAMRRYNNRRSFPNILRVAPVALLGYLWFPTAAISLQTATDWFQRTGVVIVTNRSAVFVFANLLVALIFLLSRDNNESSINTNTEPDLYDQYTSSSAASVDKMENDDSNKQIVPVFIAEVEKAMVVENRVTVTTYFKGTFRRTKSEKKNKISQPVTRFRRTESAKMVAMERLSSDDFRLKVGRFISEKKMSLVQENDVVQSQGPALASAAASRYGSY